MKLVYEKKFVEVGDTIVTSGGEIQINHFPNRDGRITILSAGVYDFVKPEEIGIQVIMEAHDIPTMNVQTFRYSNVKKEPEEEKKA